MKLYTVEQIREFEKMAIASGLTEKKLMRRAAESALAFIIDEVSEAKKMVVFCGKGNNGGDGYTLARLALIRENFAVQVRHVGKLSDLKGTAKLAMLSCKKAGIEIKPFSKQEKFSTHIIVDALLGIGIKNKVSKEYSAVIDTINNHNAALCLALDVPSGIDANTGAILGNAVRANFTITFINHKKGLFTGYGLGCSGTMALSTLGIPDFFTQAQSKFDAETIIPHDYFLKLNLRRQYSHKGNFGHVLIIGGNTGMGGAAILAGIGGLRSGAGLVSIATRPENAIAMDIAYPELMVHGVKSTAELNPLIKNATVIAIGPGLGQDEWAKKLLQQALKSDLPLVIDADALNLIAKNPQKNNNWIITPHPGEAARLLKTKAEKIQANRYHYLEELQKKYSGTVVLKGSGTLVKSENKITKVCDAGNPGMATAGTGDVLTGTIAGLVAQGMELSDAADFGVLVHAKAGDAAADHFRLRGIIASDLLPYLNKAVNFDPEVLLGIKPNENEEYQNQINEEMEMLKNEGIIGH